jgi:hypothetical protein
VKRGKVRLAMMPRMLMATPISTSVVPVRMDASVGARL